VRLQTGQPTPAAHEALDIHLSTGLSEREVSGAKASAYILPKKAASKITQGGFQVAESDRFAHR
jgi:hypothetical protein